MTPQKKWYEKNKKLQMERQHRKRKELMRWLSDHKATLSCDVCGFSFEGRPECCDFHHIDPSFKDGNIKTFISYGKNRVKAELDKCVPVCANCHRTLHQGS
jgi:predicted HNH restriction endonuclease